MAEQTEQNIKEENKETAKEAAKEAEPQNNEKAGEEDRESAKKTEKQDTGTDPGASGKEPSTERTPQTEEKKESEETDSTDKSDKKSFFKKKEKKDKKDIQIDELTDRVKRQMAEFDNFRKRTEREKASMFEMGARSVIERILPVVDNFERGMASIPESDKDSPVATGMEKIYKQFQTMLEELEVRPIEAVGQPFDPNFHNAVMHVEDESVGENVVVEEFQKGYIYRDSVIRHSMVKVAN